MAAREVNIVSGRQGSKRVFAVEAVDQIYASNRKLAKQMFEIQKQFQEVKLMHSKSGPTCVPCGGPNCGERCNETLTEEEVKYTGIRDGGIIRIFHGGTKETITRSHTIIRISLVKV